MPGRQLRPQPRQGSFAAKGATLHRLARASASLGLLGALLAMPACAPPEPPVVIDSFCSTSAPIIPPPEEIAGLSDALKRQILTHNCTGVRRCGWLPGLDPAACA